MASRLPAITLGAALASLPVEAGTALPFGPGERIRWAVSAMGVRAGEAWVEVSAGDGDALIIGGGARNAAWYGRFYTIDDRVRSCWSPEGPGSRAYTTRFREGGFHQDQHMEIGEEAIVVERGQRFSEGWREWTDRYDGPGGPVEDPTSAFFRIRLLPLDSGEHYSFQVFSGRETWELRVRVEPRERLVTALGELWVIPVQLFTRHQGDLEQRGRIVLYLTDDSRRIPVRAIMHTNVGAIRADITSYEPAEP
jgi:hypothetical protein